MAKGIARTRYIDASKLFDVNDEEFIAKRGTRHRQDTGVLLSTDFVLSMFRETAAHALDMKHDAIAVLATASGVNVAECEACIIRVKPLQSPEFDESRVATDDMREIEIRLADADIAVRSRRPAHYKQGENAAVTKRQEGLADIISLSPILTAKTVNGRSHRVVKRSCVVNPNEYISHDGRILHLSECVSFVPSGYLTELSSLEMGLVNTVTPPTQVYYQEKTIFGETVRNAGYGWTSIPTATETTIPATEKPATSIVYRPRYLGGTGEDCGTGNERNGVEFGESTITPRWSIPDVMGSGSVRDGSVKADSSPVVAMVKPLSERMPYTALARYQGANRPREIIGTIWIFRA